MRRGGLGASAAPKSDYSLTTRPLLFHYPVKYLEAEVGIGHFCALLLLKNSHFSRLIKPALALLAYCSPVPI